MLDLINTQLISSSVLENIGPFKLILKLSSIYGDIEVVFNLDILGRRLPFTKKYKSSSIYKKSKLSYIDKFVSSFLQKSWGRLPFTEKIEVVFHLQKK
jgi:hypothetical protein